jgi:hypothetical protein
MAELINLAFGPESDEQRELFDSSRRRGIDLTNSGPSRHLPYPVSGALWHCIKTATIQLLWKFSEEMQLVLTEEHDLVTAVAMSIEYKTVLRELTRTGYPEYRQLLEVVEAGLERIEKTVRRNLLRDYLGATSPEEAERIERALRGIWPEWKQELAVQCGQTEQCLSS